MTKPLDLRGVLLLLVGVIGGCSSHASTAPAPPVAPGHVDPAKLAFVKIEPVEETSAASVVVLTGRVTFDEDHTQRVASPIDGRAVALLVRPGDQARAGQPLVVLSSPHVGQLQSDAQKAEQDLAIATKALDRVTRLRADGAASDKEALQAEADFKKARSDVARTAAQLSSLGLSASNPAVTIALRSQISGTVVERNVLVGQEVRSDGANPLLTVSQLDTVWVLADVYEQDLGLVQPGAEVVVRVPAYPGEDFAGTVGHIGDLVDTVSRTVKIRCVLKNADHRLKPEMFARIELKNAAGHKSLVIPARAVISDGEKSRVIVADEGGLFHVRPAEVGPEVDGKVRVLAGLKPGEKVVTDGAIFLMQELAAR